MQMVLGVAVQFDLSRPWHRSGPVFGDLRLAPYRLGQQAFKAVVADTYQWRCAITGSKIRPALQAAHILPVKPTLGGEHRLDNGLLLRSDVHVMFDHGYVGVDPSYRLRVSPRLRSEFGNGDRSTPRPGRSSRCRSGEWTGRIRISCNGTSTPYSRPPEGSTGSPNASSVPRRESAGHGERVC